MSKTTTDISIAGIGIISPLGCGLEETEQALRKNLSAITPLSDAVFTIQQKPPLPVGQVQKPDEAAALPRTHNLAINAAKQAMAGYSVVPDAVIIGTTTGGIHSTEALRADGVESPDNYRYHGLTTVAEEIAQVVHCNGPALTVSTACSSGTTAIAMALQMLRSGEAQWVLAGGVDSLCKLTYYGFHSLQLVDPRKSRPMDTNRQGMSVAEGAALLLLTTTELFHPLGKILGYGLSCDAHHPAAPHPEGKGAATAMQQAMVNAGLSARHIDYINLHGTGTPDNDLAESRAIRSIFPSPPPLSSIKGATGHSLAASGAIEAAVATICLQKDFIPANTGCTEPDPELGLKPVLEPEHKSVSAVLSNSFGFGGNNACLIIGNSKEFPPQESTISTAPLTILGKACISGAGHTQASLEQFSKLGSMAGILDDATLSQDLPTRKIRRLGRFPRIALALAEAAKEDSKFTQSPHSVFLGSGWGALSETYDFLDKLQKSDEKFPSPIDFVGSVHNSAAGQIALMHGATGANISSSGGDYSFEQALLAAELFLDDTSKAAFVIAADEAHEQFSPLFDPSITADTPLADGGGGFSLSRRIIPGKLSIELKFYQRQTEHTLDALIARLDENNSLHHDCKMIFAGIPASDAESGEKQLDTFMEKTGLDIPVIHYRKFTGEFASASGVAAVMAAHLLDTGVVAPDKKILVLGFGKHITAMELRQQ